ncbi:MAG: PHP domain-containing protein [Candidatus Hydrogenedens sp.]|nr:PHP domain-containing protein [Candidatus Hydrogenedens sp.]
MRLKFDIHTHTCAYSPCSLIEPEELLESAVSAGLDGIVITEHHYQWTDKEIQQLKKNVDVNGLIVFAGAEITTDAGDLIVLGLPNEVVSRWKTYISIEEVIAEVDLNNGFCIAAHPTRRYHHFDEQLERLPIPAMEVMSVNMNVEEQERAKTWSQRLKRMQICASDAHQSWQVGKYWIEVELDTQNQLDFLIALKKERFKMGSY